MVTKQEIRNHYASKNEYNECPGWIDRQLETVNYPEDEVGIYNLIGELFGKREYCTLDEVSAHLVREIECVIRDLQGVAAFIEASE